MKISSPNSIFISIKWFIGKSIKGDEISPYKARGNKRGRKDKVIS